MIFPSVPLAIFARVTALSAILAVVTFASAILEVVTVPSLGVPTPRDDPDLISTDNVFVGIAELNVTRTPESE